MNAKRWTAIGLSLVVFISSLIISAAGNWFIGGDEGEVLTLWEELFAVGLSETIQRDGDPFNRIAVLDVSGIILNTSSGYLSVPEYNHAKMLNDLETIRNDTTIKAVILRVNSPGGGVYESAELNAKMNEVMAEKDIPLYVVMESMAASGGYYIAANAEKIFASADTITGSIGVIMSGLNYSGLMEKYGVSDLTIKSGDLKDMGSPTRPTTDRELEVLQGLIDSMYERFVDVVSEGRNMDRDMVYSLADGRIYDGYQAKEAGLVDELGFYEDALKDLETAYGLENAQIISYELTQLNLLSDMLINTSRFLNPRQNIDVNLSGIELPTSWQEQRGFMYIFGGY